MWEGTAKKDLLQEDLRKINNLREKIILKTVEEIIKYLENEKLYCFEMHEEYRGKDSANSLQYLIRAITIEGILNAIQE